MMSRLPLNVFMYLALSLTLLSLSPVLVSAEKHSAELSSMRNEDKAGGVSKSEDGLNLEESDLDTVLEGFDDSDKVDSEDQGLEEILKGFEEEPAEDLLLKDETHRPYYWDISGSVTLGASYNYAHEAPDSNETDYRGLSRLRIEIDLDLDIALSELWKALISGRGFYDFAYAINGRDEYTDEVLDSYEREAEFQEVYIQGSLLPRMDVKFGRQIVVWGKSDNIRVVDVLNPLDNREPGIVDIEDLRLPVVMTRMDYYYGKWNLTGIAVHEIRFNKNPEFGSDFYPIDYPPPHEEIPSEGVNNTEYAAALNGIMTGWDLSLYWARFFDDRPHVELVSSGTSVQPELSHSRLTMVGTAFTIARGNWLIKSEAAWFDGLEFLALPDEEKSRFDILVGLEYSGFEETTISLELVNRHINGFDSQLEMEPDNAQKNTFQTALRYQGNFMHDTLHVTLLALAFDGTGQDGALQRLSVEYDIKDDLSVTCGIINYISGDTTEFKNIGDNDRLFLDARYSF